MRLLVPRKKFQGPLYDRLLKPYTEKRWDEIDEEYLVEGPTGTGKSVGIAHLYYHMLREFPGCQLLVIRYVKADLGASFMHMWENQVLNWNDPWDRWMMTNGNPSGRVPGHRSREVYSYPNGSNLWCRGMDQWARFKSMEFDGVWPMEMTEFAEEDIEGLHTRIREHGGVPFGPRILIGDVNPEYPQHWANQRAMPDGPSTRIKTTLRDNPGYFNRLAGKFTRAGREYLGRLEKQIRDPARRMRYIQGIWTAATGQILNWDEERHMFDARLEMNPRRPARLVMDKTHPVLGDEVELVGFGASYDWASAHAGTLQVWGTDKVGRQYLVEEVYHSKKPVQWWANWAVKLWKKYQLQFIVCDSAKVGGPIDTFNERLVQEGGGKARIAIQCNKRSGNRQESNMELLQDLFCDQADGAPGVFLKRNALAHAPDQDLTAKCFADEIPAYVYQEYDPGRHRGRPEDRPDRKCVDDGLDACTYFRVHMLGGRKLKFKLPEKRHMTHEEKVRKAYWDDHYAA